MQIEYLKICRFKSIICLEIEDISQALILVGQNSTGKTTVLDAIRAVGGDYRIVPEDFDESGANIEITVRLSLCEEDLKRLQKRGKVSSYRRWDSFLADVKKKLPSFDGETLTFTYIVNRDSRQRFDDGFKKTIRTSGMFFLPFIILMRSATRSSSRMTCCICRRTQN